MQGGGIGNRILQIWAGIAYAKETGREFVFYEPHMTPNPHTISSETRAFLFGLFPSVRLHKGYVKWQMRGASDPGRHVLLDGFFNSFQEGCGSRGTLVVPMPPPPLISSFGDLSRTYFIHFRFGDFVGTHYAVDLSNYYMIAVASVLAEDPDAVFLLFSDEPSRIDVKGVGLSEGQYTIVLAGVGMWETFWLMSRCFGGICANSTFSTCAAWAVPGPVYMPRMWKAGFPEAPLPTWVHAI
jgi:hypothetical protein